MKTNLFRTSSILAVLILLVALGLTSTAQEQISRQQQPAQQQERQILDLPVQQLDAEALRVRVPHCPKPPVVQLHGVIDNFNPPGGPVTPSPALTSFLGNSPIKGYDDPRVNRVFADSFKLEGCNVCYATLEFSVRHYQDIWLNDSMTVGGAPFTNTTPLRVIAPQIWSPVLQSPINITGGLNSYIFTYPTRGFLDVVAQDDTDFDYMKLTVWYY